MTMDSEYKLTFCSSAGRCVGSKARLATVMVGLEVMLDATYVLSSPNSLHAGEPGTKSPEPGIEAASPGERVGRETSSMKRASNAAEGRRAIVHEAMTDRVVQAMRLNRQRGQSVAIRIVQIPCSLR